MNTCHTRPMPPHNQHVTLTQRGITLIEVMVSIVLMSITLLGIAGLISSTTKFQLGVDSRSAITYLANDLAGRMRANLNTTLDDRSTWVAHYTGLGVSTSSWSAQQSISTTPSAYCGTGSGTPSACTRADLAAFDVAEIRGSMARTMSQPALQLVADANGNVTATFMWFDKDFTSLVNDVMTLSTSATCSNTMNSIQQQTCCPSAASVSSTPGVRCLNLRFAP